MTVKAVIILPIPRTLRLSFDLTRLASLLHEGAEECLIYEALLSLLSILLLFDIGNVVLSRHSRFRIEALLRGWLLFDWWCLAS
jgi:hypothetical protein